MAPIPPNARLAPEPTADQPSQTVRAIVGGVQFDVIADIALKPQVVGVTATQRPAPSAPTHSATPPREPSRLWWLPWALLVLAVLAVIGWWQNSSRPATVSLPVPPTNTTNTPTPASVLPSRECGGALQSGCVTFRGDVVRLIGNVSHQWGEYKCRFWGPKSLVCDLKVASSEAVPGRIWLVRGNGPRGPVTSIGRNPPESP